MFSRLTRILMALVTAFVFTGQMEAAAQHCARLAKAAAIVVSPDHGDAPCHNAKASDAMASMADMQMSMGHDHAAMNHGAPDHSGHTKSPPHCECIAALSGWIDLDGATTATHVETYAWLAPSETSFASATSDPDLRPPRA